ncbi:ABC transporter ATP-binding protein [Limnohabitans sp. DCL3]|uniref:ABC transporter ATP-binding protein n=1 Tax=Limnohabitans sp. DCL3 TaxID=3374103 RepID=UPI003A8BCDAD
MTSAVSLRDVSCVFRSAGKTVHAVAGIDLQVQAGEFFTLLGPSGSGKTTCLRMIGGFTLPTKGLISIHGQDVSQLPPYARPVNTVFQDYALFPHMSILDNVAYGLMVRGVDLSTREKKAQQLLDTVQLSEVGQRKPGQLSGGQRQRVALARALINAPRVLLLDEPLGALDLKLREQMQTELKSLQRQLGITFIFVTHDQHEALSMSDRIGVFNQGRLEQVATPSELYARPTTRFVAEFVGAANVLQGEQAHRYAAVQALMIRPECITLLWDSSETSTSQTMIHSAARLRARVQEAHFFGAFWRMHMQPEHGGAHLLVDVPVQSGQAAPPPGAMATLCWPNEAMHALKVD